MNQNKLQNIEADTETLKKFLRAMPLEEVSSFIAEVLKTQNAA